MSTVAPDVGDKIVTVGKDDSFTIVKEIGAVVVTPLLPEICAYTS